MQDEIPVYLFRIIEDGKVLAEAKLEVPEEHNERAWELFQDAFALIQPTMVGSLYQTLRIACGQSPVPAGQKEVVGLGIESKRPTNIIIPEFTHKNGVH